MRETFQLISREPSKDAKRLFTGEKAIEAWQFHRSFPDYEETPLADLTCLAEELGVAGLYIKDESRRFGQNAFKVLGGSYCLGRCIAEELGEEIEDLPYSRLVSPSVSEKIGCRTFVTATDGNHGRGIAWTANRLGQACVVYMPKGSAAERLEPIRALGAEVFMTECNYDDTVRLARKQAEEKGWILVQDTSWEGYEKIPAWIMQGYTTMAYEVVHQMKEPPTHVFLQAGVGAMAGALTGFFADYYGAEMPVITLVEPEKADCIFRTAKAADGKLHKVDGDLSTIMAGLACGEPCHVGWSQIRAYARHFASVPDWTAAKGMRILANPLGSDPKVISGESGAVTTGLVCQTLLDPGLREWKERIGLNESSRILCISTEGDTDRANYRRVIWDGAYPSRTGEVF